MDLDQHYQEYPEPPWNSRNLENRDDKEDYREFLNFGGSRLIEWINKNGKHHRIDAPAIIFFDRNGNAKLGRWLINGIKHREDGPFFRKANFNGWSLFNYQISKAEHGEIVSIYNEN